jgi:hypothetical protein
MLLKIYNAILVPGTVKMEKPLIVSGFFISMASQLEQNALSLEQNALAREQNASQQDKTASHQPKRHLSQKLPSAYLCVSALKKICAICFNLCKSVGGNS